MGVRNKESTRYSAQGILGRFLEIFGGAAPELLRANGVAYVSAGSALDCLYGDNVFLPESQKTRAYIEKLKKIHPEVSPKKGNLKLSGHGLAMKGELETYMGVSSQRIEKVFGRAEYSGRYGRGKEPLKSITVDGYYLPRHIFETIPVKNNTESDVAREAAVPQHKKVPYIEEGGSLTASSLRAGSGRKHGRYKVKSKIDRYSAEELPLVSQADKAEKARKDLEAEARRWLSRWHHNKILPLFCRNIKKDTIFSYSRVYSMGIDSHDAKSIFDGTSQGISALYELRRIEDKNFNGSPKITRGQEEVRLPREDKEVILYFAKKYGLT